LDTLFARDPIEIARTFFFDSIVYDKAALEYLAAKVGGDRVVVGSDYPFTIKQDRPAVFAEQALAVSRQALTANAKRWLGFET
jgi:aminocarboxymuconate-semialdehyde decarboxylase